MKRVPPSKRAWSIVSIGRFSRRFVTQWLAQGWDARIGAPANLIYEEISLPHTCLMTDGCVLAEFGLFSELGRRILYKPMWSCEQVLRSRRVCDHGLFHPVKERSCLLESLTNQSGRDACAGNQKSLLSLPPPDVLWVGGQDRAWLNATATRNRRQQRGQTDTMCYDSGDWRGQRREDCMTPPGQRMLDFQFELKRGWGMWGVSAGSDGVRANMGR